MPSIYWNRRHQEIAYYAAVMLVFYCPTAMMFLADKLIKSLKLRSGPGAYPDVYAAS